MIRTCDARFRKPTLYPLSYGAMGLSARHESSAWLAEMSRRLYASNDGIAPIFRVYAPDRH